jgi:exodeoxyribonuclease V gamma subunit
VPSRPPGLTVRTSPRLEPLFDALAAGLAADPLPPLERETILVAQNKGLQAWVRQGLARRLGCAAALDLRAPLDLANDLARWLVPEGSAPEGERHPFEASALAWRLAALLDPLPEDPCYDPLRAYLARTDGAVMPLATRLTRLFDSYQLYRPDVLAAWGRGEDPLPTFAHGCWQAPLWRLLLAGTPVRDRGATLALLAERLAGREVRAGLLPPRIAVFGAALFPVALYRVLAVAAQHVPVTLYAVTPGPEPRTEPFAHPLLRALAGGTCDYWTVLADLGAPAPARLAEGGLLSSAGATPTPPLGEVARRAGGGLVPLAGGLRQEQDPPSPLARTAPRGGQVLAEPSALRQLQVALAEDAPPEAPVPLDPADRSLRVHDCHSEVRELEALRDALLDAFAELDGLRPSDCLALVPDLRRYAPLVDAVFSAETVTGDLRLPVHVVDHPHAPARRVLDAVAKALRLHEGRVTASELLDLLHHPAVRRRAGVSEDELTLLRAWVRESGVCWGLTAAQKARFDLPDCDLHTWRFGLDRLILGVATGEGGGLVLGHLPCDAAGLSGADLLGRFAEWAEALFAALHALDHPRPLSAWPDEIATFLDGFLDARAEEEVEAVVFLREQAADLLRLRADAEDEPRVPFRAVRSHLEAASVRFEAREPYLTGAVTFADPLVLRHAPHRFVAFLGLNDGVYPRPEPAPAFDLLAVAPRPGDPAPRRTEKQLALDAVLAARDRLLLSYVGRSQKDNAERAASVVLDAVLDAAERHWGPEAPERLTVRHRLQPFAAAYFAEGSPLQSYAAQHCVRPAASGDGGPFLAGPLPTGTLPTGDGAPPVAPEAVSLGDLAGAWTSPSRYLIRRRLRISLDLDEGAAQDDEPVALDNLSAFSVRQALLEALLDGCPEPEAEERLLRSGRLPGGAPGAAWLRREIEAVRPLVARVCAFGETLPRAVSVEVDGARVEGTVERVGERGALRYRAGTVRQKDLVAAWVDHLALAASGHAVPTTLLGTKESCRLAPLPPDDAALFLRSLLRGWRRAAAQALPLYEQASYAYAKALKPEHWAEFAARILDRERGDGGERKPFNPATHAMKKARDGFDPFGDAPGDKGDVYVGLATRGRDPFGSEDRFARWALCLWAPLLLHRQDLPPAA